MIANYESQLAAAQAELEAERARPLADRVIEWVEEHSGPLTQWQEHILRRTYSLADDGRPWFERAGRPAIDPDTAAGQLHAAYTVGKRQGATVGPMVLDEIEVGRLVHVVGPPEQPAADYRIDTAGKCWCNHCGQPLHAAVATNHRCPAGRARSAGRDAWRAKVGLPPAGRT